MPGSTIPDGISVLESKAGAHSTPQRKTSYKKQVSFDDKSTTSRSAYRTRSSESNHMTLGRRRSSTVKHEPSLEERLSDEEGYVIKSDRIDLTTSEDSCFETLCPPEIKTAHTTITNNNKLRNDRDPDSKDFWDAFEEDDIDDDVFLDHQICYTPCDVVTTTLQLTASAVLLLLTWFTLSTVQLSLVTLTRFSKAEEKPVGQLVIMFASLTPTLISLPHSALRTLWKRSRFPSFSLSAVIAVSVALDVYSLTLLSVYLLPKLDVIEALFVLAAISSCSHSYKAVFSTGGGQCATEGRSVIGRYTLATIIQTGTSICLAINRFLNDDIDSALLIPFVIITSCFAELLSSSVNVSQKSKNSTELISSTFKVLFTVLLGWVFIDIPMTTIAQQLITVPKYAAAAGIAILVLPCSLLLLIKLIRLFKLSKGASSVLMLTTPLSILALSLLAWGFSTELCLQKSLSGECQTSAILAKRLSIKWSHFVFIAAWFWSYVTLTSLTNADKSPSGLVIQKAESFVIGLLNCSTSRVEKSHNLSASNILPIHSSRKVIGLGEGRVEVGAGPSGDKITPRLYLCATMWHESRREMSQLLTSTFKLDEFQCMKRQTNDLLSHAELSLSDPDYFDFETHVMFDDAMSWGDNGEETVNDFVSEFVEIVQDTAQKVHGAEDVMDTPIKLPTPYGGRLTFTLPGGNHLIVHLKDKTKIRNKKRWSMIQYMYYLLGYKLLSEFSEDYEKLSYQGIPSKTQQAADNTFLLTVDGDVQFEPESIQQLIKQLKKNEQVGVVCGRIHPMGSGLLVWYQRFEYAIAHWLHKTAEHVMGVVLCTPGAFSMFKASALMDRNIIKTFTREVKSGRDALQYEQGEDRWLCSLLFQQGHRCEYVPTASARTFAPETLDEFFNQRRRWALSTVVNHYDLLLKWRNSYLRNKDISLSYVLFEAMLFLTTILGPAYVLLLITYANTAVFGLDQVASYFLSIAPPLLYALLCLYITRQNQVRVAYILSLYYGCLMALYFAWNVFTMFDYSMITPLGILMIVLGCLFLLTAILHPKESGDLLPVVLYFLLIPTTYMILMIYCILNLNNISWGTREITPTPRRKSKSYDTKYRNDLVNPSWAEGKALHQFQMKYLDENEIVFWSRLISQYLKPYSHNAEDKAILDTDLLSLRNKSAAVYFIINGLALYGCYLAQKYTPHVQLVSSTESDIEPIALMCIVMFGLLALAQFLCLLWQRAGRLMLACASKLRLRKSSTETHPDLDTAKFIVENLKKLNLTGSSLKRISEVRTASPSRISSLNKSSLSKLVNSSAEAHLMEV